MVLMRGLLGIFVILIIAGMFSENKRKIDYRVVVVGILLQFLLAILFFKVEGFSSILQIANSITITLDTATASATGFVFGFVGGGTPPFEVTDPSYLFPLAFRFLPLVIVFSALCSLLFYLKVLPWFLRGVSWCMRRTMRVGACESFSMAANIVMGMTEAPLSITPYLKSMSRSELFAVMTGGMATVAGTMLVLYANILNPVMPGVLGHLLVASFISAPATFVIAKIMIPMERSPVNANLGFKREASGVFDSLTIGATRGLALWLNIVVMLITFLALIFLINAGLDLFPEVGAEKLTLERIFGWIFSPLAWLIGVEWSEAATVGELMGKKIAANEFIAYLNLAELSEGALSERSRIITIYALCGFANFGSAGIMTGAFAALLPSRRAEIAELAIWSVLSGLLATCMTGAVAGIIF